MRSFQAKLLLLTLWIFAFGWSLATPVEAAHYPTLQEAFHEGIANAAYYDTPRGHKLRYAHFKSPVPGPRSSVLLLQGRASFLEFYEVLVVPLLERGLDVWMYDLSGQGGSSRLLPHGRHDDITRHRMQHIDSFEFYVEDASAFIKDIFLPRAEGQLFIGGYSSGGHVALRYLQRTPDTPFEAAFVISPFLSLKTAIPNKLLAIMFRGASLFVNLDRYFPGASNDDPTFTVPFEENLCSGDVEGFEEIKDLCYRHPHYMMGGVSYGWLKAAVDSLECIWDREAIQSVRIPVLMATAGKDGLIEVCYNGQFADQLPKAKHVYYPESRHEIFRDTQEVRKQWWMDFDEFFSIVRRKQYPPIFMWARQAAIVGDHKSYFYTIPY